ncbi:hypothetical protein V9T40_012509 [Parthenolecanium corni]|uniref:Hcy-binding domain-containing protein n=1 Tax=Parthenolecanium corni TaxID=536013 RepID=A0AAN9T7E1_9HEMI
MNIVDTVKVLDGGFSSQLSRHLNMEAESTSHPLWCARFLFTDPGSVVDTHRDYIRAGADIVMTNTYQASVDGFQKYFELEACESYRLIKDAVHFVKRAIALENVHQPVGKNVLIAGSVGSYGACLHDGSEYRGDYVKKVPLEIIKTWHRPRISALVEAGVDFLAFETIPALAEAEVLVELLKEFPNQKAWVSFTCKDAKHTAASDDIKQAAKRLWSLNPDQLIAVGVNCLHPSLVSPLITSIREANESGPPIPTIAYPNNGEHYDTSIKCWVKQKGSPPVHSYVPEWLNNGLSIVGGCCKTTADDIRIFRNFFDKAFGFRLTGFSFKNQWLSAFSFRLSASFRTLDKCEFDVPF